MSALVPVPLRDSSAEPPRQPLPAATPGTERPEAAALAPAASQPRPPPRQGAKAQGMHGEVTASSILSNGR
jgi:hypothetical protein